MCGILQELLSVEQKQLYSVLDFIVALSTALHSYLRCIMATCAKWKRFSVWMRT